MKKHVGVHLNASPASNLASTGVFAKRMYWHGWNGSAQELQTLLDTGTIIADDAGKNRRANGKDTFRMVRRTYQEGHVFRRGKRRKVWVGRWRVHVIIGGQFRRKHRSVVLGRCHEMTKGEAERRLQDVLRPINEGSQVPEQCITFDRFSSKWEEEILEHYRESTRGFYKATLHRWILPYFRGWRLSDIKTLDIQSFVNRFAHYSKSALKHVRATLSVLMATAVDWQYVQHNPVKGVKLPEGQPAQRARTLKAVEIRKVVDGLAEPFKTMVVIAASTGMRESEVLALRWDDIDQRGQVINVRRSVYRSAVGEPKSRSGGREIPYGPAVTHALWCLSATGEHPSGYLFVAPKGGFYSPQRITKVVFKPLAAELKIKDFAWRSFRRSAATAMHIAGTPLKVQQEILGHATADMSLLYSEAAKPEQRRAIEQLDRQLFPNVPRLQLDLQNRLAN